MSPATDQILEEAPPTPETVETIGGYRVHPAARLLPEPSPEDYARLRADIEQHGLLVPIVVTPAGEILDGRTRARICEELGIKWGPNDLNEFYNKMTVTLDREEALDPVAYVLSMNAARRHLPQEQVAAIWLKHRDPATVKAEAEAGKATRQANLKQGAARKAHVDPSGTEASKTLQAAKATKPPVSKSTLKRVRKVARLAPERLDDVAAGKVSALKVLEEIVPPAAEVSSNRGTKSDEHGVAYLDTLGRRRPNRPLSERMKYALDIGLSVGIQYLGQFLLEARQQDHQDLPRWIKKSVDLHAKLGMIIDLVQREKCPDRDDLQALLYQEDEVDGAAGIVGQPLIHEVAGSAEGAVPIRDDAQ